ncbi:MAG: hypothetical protein AB7F41_06990 [Methylocystis sp.]|uniref:hypothetical protein n=1 Tax=Methylocystis sp. TaxID=1911079 RepID=UPI003D1445BD
MIDLKFTALMDFLAFLRGQYPQKIESGGAEEFVPYEDVRASETEPGAESKAVSDTTGAADEQNPSKQ